MGIEKRREWTFLLLVVLIGIGVLYKTVRLRDEGAILMVIEKQNGPLSKLDTPRKPSGREEMYVQAIDFFHGRVLENAQYGKLGFTTNFFIDFMARIQVRKTGMYRFYVESDDGFRMKIDGNTVCEHPQNRPFETTECDVRLNSGRHVLALSYFQGGGPMGLKASYVFEKKGRRYLVGEDSAYITFEKIKK